MAETNSGGRLSGLQVKLTFWFLVLSIVPIVCLGYLANTIAGSAMERAYYESLRGVTNRRESQLATYLKDRIEMMEQVADRRIFRDNTKLPEIIQELTRFQKKFAIFYEVFLVDRNGKIVASSDKSNIGLDKSNDLYYTESIKGKPYIKDVYLSDITHQVGLTISVPVFETNMSKIAGVLVGRIKMEGINAITMDQVGLGKTGETYLVNIKDKLFMSESRHEKDVVLKQKVDTMPVKAWQEKGLEFVGIYKDYRGQIVVGALGGKVFKDEFNKDWVLISEIDDDEAFAAIFAMRWLIFILTLVAALVVMFCAYLIARGISNPIIHLSSLLRKVEEGNLGVEIKRSALKDEVGTLINDTAGMLAKLRGLIAGINDGGSQITTASAEMRATIQEQVSGAAEQSSAVAETSTAIAELSQTASNISKIAQDVQKSSEMTMNGINEANAKINETAKKILALGEKSQNVGEIVKLIDDLSDQINLLALNAKIEAARAGEAGKGFAVVATEISKLADKSTESTDAIRKLVTEIQSETSAAVMDVEESVKRGARGVEMTQQTVQKIKEVTMATQQQQSASDQMLTAVKNIDQVAKEFVASTKQTSVAVENLNKLAAGLKKAVEQFKL